MFKVYASSLGGFNVGADGVYYCMIISRSPRTKWLLVLFQLRTLLQIISLILIRFLSIYNVHFSVKDDVGRYSKIKYPPC